MQYSTPVSKFISFLISILFLFFSCTPQKSPFNTQTEKSTITHILNDWHQAASEADFDRYFGYLSDESIFMGTDETEYWNKSEFETFAKPYFDKGKAWDFKVVSRNLYLSNDGKMAWFDEVLDTPNLGPSRGSGVLSKNSDIWKIEHYNLSIPIPNDIVGDIVQEIRTFHNSK